MKYVDDELDKNTILRFIQKPQNYLKMFVGSNVYNIRKCDRKQILESSVIEVGNAGRYLLQQWNKKCNGKNNAGNITNCIRSTRTKTPNLKLEQPTYHLFVINSCILKQVVLILVKMFPLV